MATFNLNKNNLIAGTTYSTLASGATSLLVSFDTDTTSGNATASSSSDVLPDAPFFATLSPSGAIPNLLNSEIVLVTAKTWVSSSKTWQFTIQRAQRSTTARAFGAGSVFLGGVYTEDLDYSQAVGKGFFTATYSAGAFYINDVMLPTAPTDGMSIKVVFSQDVASGTLGLSLNSGTIYNVYSGAAITSLSGDAASTPLVKSGIIYELVFYNGAWYAMNVPAASSIMSQNVDWTTIGAITVRGATETDYDANQKIALESVSAEVGNKFTLYDSMVIVGDGVSAVEVSASVFMQYTSINYGWAVVQQNGSNIDAGRAIGNLSNSSYTTISITPTVVPVKSGDQFRLWNIDPCRIRGGNSWMTVKQLA